MIIIYIHAIHFPQQETTNQYISIWKFNSTSRQAYSVLSCKYVMVLTGGTNNININIIYMKILYCLFWNKLNAQNHKNHIIKLLAHWWKHDMNMQFMKKSLSYGTILCPWVLCIEDHCMSPNDFYLLIITLCRRLQKYKRHDHLGKKRSTNPRYYTKLDLVCHIT